MSDPDHFATLQADVIDEPYRVEIPNVGRFELAHVNTLSAFDLNSAYETADTQLGYIINMIQLVMTPEGFAELQEKKVNRATLAALFAAWEKHCGTGESPASSS